MVQEVLIDIMNVKFLFLIAVTICCRLTVASEVEVVSNRVFTSNTAFAQSCVVHEYAKDTMITNVAIPNAEIVQACCLADVYLRKIALREYSIPKMQIDVSGRRYMVAHDSSCMFPVALPSNFEIFGLPYKKLNQTVLPYIVTNKHLEGHIKGVLCEYKLNGKFQFGLYVNLNTYSVSPDFQRGVSCRIIVSGLGRFPFIEEENVRAQEVFVTHLGGTECQQLRTTGLGTPSKIRLN